MSEGSAAKASWSPICTTATSLTRGRPTLVEGFFTETDSFGTTWRGFLFNDGKAFWKTSVSLDLTQGLAIGTLGTTSAPDTCDRAGFRMIRGFDAPNESFITILPLTNMFLVPDAQRGVGSFFAEAAGLSLNPGPAEPVECRG